MQAKDIMSTSVAVVGPDTTVTKIARLLLRRGISAVPVVDDERRVIGIVSEGDLMRRPEAGTERRPSWWLTLIVGEDDAARDYVKVHGRCAADVMTRDVITIDEETSLAEIATLLEKHRIKRVPVVSGGTIVGIVSRADLLHGLVAHPPAKPASASDRELRDRILEEIHKTGVDVATINVVVSSDIVDLWGAVWSDEQLNAVRLAVENVVEGKTIRNHMGIFPSMLQSLMYGE